MNISPVQSIKMALSSVWTNRFRSMLTILGIVIGITTVVSVAGHMSTSMPGGPAPVDVPDAMLLAAIVNSPKGPYYFKGTGTKKSVEANAAKFRTMLASLKLK